MGAGVESEQGGLTDGTGFDEYNPARPEKLARRTDLFSGESYNGFGRVGLRALAQLLIQRRILLRVSDEWFIPCFIIP